MQNMSSQVHCKENHGMNFGCWDIDGGFSIQCYLPTRLELLGKAWMEQILLGKEPSYNLYIERVKTILGIKLSTMEMGQQYARYKLSAVYKFCLNMLCLMSLHSKSMIHFVLFEQLSLYEPYDLRSFVNKIITWSWGHSKAASFYLMHRAIPAIS